MAAPKRNPHQKAADLAFVSHHRARGMSFRKILDLLNERNKGVYTLTRRQIEKDVDQVNEEWKRESSDSIETWRKRELEGLRIQEEEAWAAFEKSKLEFTSMSAEEATGAPTPPQREPREGEAPQPPAPPKGKKRILKESSCGDPRWMDLILKIRERRAKLLGLDAPIRTELSGPEGGPIPIGRDEALERVYGVNPPRADTVPGDNGHSAGNGNGNGASGHVE